ncbi:MAG: hypothetical protein J6A22_03620 [Bacteroidales bacterium]|nr:hypothetical protein [Bacteroidales bacterium]
MKRIFYLFLAAAFALASCQKVDQLEQTGDEGVVTFSVNLPGSISTKAVADGEKAVKLFYATYTEDGRLIKSLCDTTVGVTVDGKKAQIKLQLVKNLVYDVVFWAQSPDCKAFEFNWADAVMTVDYKGLANDDNRDAFYALEDNLTVTNAGLEKDVILYRPFAQINFGSADYQAVVDYYDAASVDSGMKSAVVSIDVPNTLNLCDQTIGTSVAEMDFTLAAIPNDPRLLNVNGKDYKYVSMNYILAPNGKEPYLLPEITANFQFTAGNINRTIDVKNVPFLRNHRTNIIGNFFTETAVLNIVVDEDFQKPDFNIIDPAVVFTQRKLDSLARIPSTNLFVPAGNWNVPSEIASGVVFVGAEGTVLTAGNNPFTVGGDTQVVLEDGSSLVAASGNAITLADNANVTLTVKGTASISAAGNAVWVPASSSLTVTGGNLIVTGGSGVGGSSGGSGIGGDGSITINAVITLQ